jgi:hypothetical protein
MVQNDPRTASGNKQLLVKVAIFLCAAVIVLWLGAYFLGLQIYDAALQLTH